MVSGRRLADAERAFFSALTRSRRPGVLLARDGDARHDHGHYRLRVREPCARPRRRSSGPRGRTAATRYHRGDGRRRTRCARPTASCCRASGLLPTVAPEPRWRWTVWPRRSRSAVIDAGPPLHGHLRRHAVDWRRKGLEHGTHDGFGWVPGTDRGADAGTRPAGAAHGMERPRRFARPAIPVLAGVETGAHAYFVHSYAFRAADPAHVSGGDGLW